jgi:putative Mg2+ transporter-C (MgtC) family protein
MLLPEGAPQWAETVARVGVAYALSFPTAWFSEKEGHAVGIRTFPIVAMASCAFVLLAAGPSGADTTAATSRIIQGLIAGIGFVGGGAILKDGMSVHGTATAASIWNTGALGAAVALGRYEIAIALAILNIFTIEGLAPVKRRLDAEGAEEKKKH